MKYAEWTIAAMLLISNAGLAQTNEVRTWNFKTGESLDAEYVKDYLGKVVLKDGDGKEWTLKEENFVLSEADKEYLELQHPPELKLEFRKSIVRKNYTMIRFAEDRPEEQRAEFGALIKQTSYLDYRYELNVEFFAIGSEIEGNRFLLLDRLSTPFQLTKENGRKFEFYSDRVVRLTDMWGNSENYSRRGEQYYGFLIVVTDRRGKVIAADASNDWLLDHLDTLRKREIGNYMDKTCQQTYPTRPKSYIASTAATRE